MGIDQNFFKDKGYTIYRDTNNNVGWYAGKIVDAHCETNEKCNIIVRPFSVDGLHLLYEVSIRGQHETLWYELKAYSLLDNEVRNISDIEKKLLAAWNGMLHH